MASPSAPVTPPEAMPSPQEVLPVGLLPTEPWEAIPPPRRGIGICLSGGGFRAMLFHVGALWRLLDAGLLDPGPTARLASSLGRLERVSSVSGGSITSALLALRWDLIKPHDSRRISRARIP